MKDPKLAALSVLFGEQSNGRNQVRGVYSEIESVDAKH
jgi:hypothetical protein